MGYVVSILCSHFTLSQSHYSFFFFWSQFLCTHHTPAWKADLQWQSTPVLLPGKSHGVTKSRTQLSDFTFTFSSSLAVSFSSFISQLKRPPLRKALPHLLGCCLSYHCLFFWKYFPHSVIILLFVFLSLIARKPNQSKYLICSVNCCIYRD